MMNVPESILFDSDRIVGALAKFFGGGEDVRSITARALLGFFAFSGEAPATSSLFRLASIPAA
jgi:hypothetical protein